MRYSKLVLVFVMGVAGAQIPVPIPDSWSTQGVYNGRWWNAAPPEIRMGYVVGYADYRAIQPDTLPWFTAAFQYKEVVKGLSDFYRDPANAPVPIPSAFAWVACKFRGDAPEKLDQLAAILRRVGQPPSVH
jgi:hypothetical protein